jgi:spore coat polysaccharide biosynthesis protein SpsF (cytidylyltransferase family)
MTSKRYPGKMLAPFLGKPVLAHVVEKIQKSKINPKIVLATSKNTTDDPLVLYAKNLGIDVVRGSQNDIFERYILTLKKFKCDAFFRVCGDSPLLFPLLFDKAASIYKNSKYDLITNVFPRTFPIGMSVELINTRTFIKMDKKIKSKNDREHISQYFYRNGKKFKIYNIECGRSSDRNLKLALDVPNDLKKLEEWDLKRNKNYKDIFPVNEKK